MDQGKIGAFIMERRKRLGLTQSQLAEKLNITDRAVSKWETGKSLPDSSIMLELCGILGITVDALLTGGGTAEAERPAPPPQRPPGRRSLSPRARRRLSLLLSGGLLAGVFICFICDTALSGGLTWSLIVAASAAYAWALLLPAAALERRGLTGSLLALSVFTLPYLYGLSRLLNVGAVFTVGAVMAVLSILFLWLLFAAVRRMGWGTAALGAGFLLLAGLTAAVNGALYILKAAPPPDAWSGMSVLLLLTAAAASFTWRRDGREP